MDDEIGGYLDANPLEQWHYTLLDDWLIPVQYLWEEPLLCSTHNPESAQWFLDSVPYQKWIHADTRSAPGRHPRDRLTLVCSGPEGVGKTFLASAVVHDLCRRFRSDTTSDVGIAYVFCSASFHETQDASNLLLALLQQLLSPFPAKNVSSSWDFHLSREEVNEPSPAVIGEALTAAIMAYKQVFFVVDGLDQCPPQKRESLLQELFELQVNHAVRLLVTTTAKPEINSLFVHDSHMSIPYPAANTMRSFVARQIRNAPPGFLKIEPKIKETIMDAVVHASDRSFVLAQLQLQILFTSPCLSSLEAALLAMRTGSYLQGFDGVYDVMVQRIQDLQPEKLALAQLALACVACARRPLTVEELYITLTMETSGPPLYSSAVSYINDVLGICSGLLRVAGTVADQKFSDSLTHKPSRFIPSVERENLSARLWLVHHTAYVYLQRISEQFLLDGEKHMTHLCLRYLSMPHLEDGICNLVQQRLRTYPLYNYAALHWGHHARAALFDLHALESGSFRFFESPRHIDAACQVLFWKNEFITRQAVMLPAPRNICWLHLAGHFGILGLLCKTSLNDKKFHNATNPKDSTGTRALGYAVREGNIEAVSLILKSTNVNMDSRDYQQRTLLMLAAMNGHLDVAELLLSLGADPNLADKNGCTPLWYAAEQGHAAVARLLLSGDIKVDVNLLHAQSGRDQHTPLSLAASKGYDAVACLLLAQQDINPEKGAILLEDSNPSHIHSEPMLNLHTPLWLALNSGHRIVAAMLVGRSDVDLNFTPSRQGQAPEVRFRPASLLTRTDDHNEELALEKSDRDSMDSSTLLENPTIDSILYLAVRNGDEAFVELLLDRNVDATVQNLAWGTPLHHAIQMGHEAVVALLTSRLGTSSLGVVDSTGYTPEEVAVCLGRVRIMRLLLNAGADPQVRDRNGRTLLAFAANLGEERIVALLLESESVDANSQDNHGRTPLSLALSPCQGGHLGHRWRHFRRQSRSPTEASFRGIVRRLLDSGRVNVNCRDDIGRVPLSDAARNGSLRTLDMLLQQAETKASLDYRDNNGVAALHHAADGGNEECVMRLLEEGAEPDDLLLSIAASSGQTAVVKALIAHPGIHLDDEDHSGYTPLCRAAMEDHMPVVEELLVTGSVNAMARDRDGKTLLHYAASSKNSWLLSSHDSKLLSTGIISRLIRTEGVDVNARDNMGQTALSLATQRGLLHSMELLLSFDNIEPDIRDNTGRTPLSWAAQESHMVVQRLLEDDRVDPNVEDEQGWTPLFWAINYGTPCQGAMIDVLLGRAVDKTVDIHHKDKQGHTPLSRALSYRNTRLASSLRMAVAQSNLSGRRNGDNLAPAIDLLAEAEYAKLLPRELAPTFLDPSPDWFHSGSGHDRPEAASRPPDESWNLARNRFVHLREQHEMEEESQLCARCSELDLDAAFSLIPKGEGTIDPSIQPVHIMPLTTPQCAMCRLLHQLSTDRVVDEHWPEPSLCATSACEWLVRTDYNAGGDLMKWGWVDAVFLKYPQFDTQGGFIARVGSNDPNGMHSVTIHGLGEDADFNQARKWLTACTEHHGSRCQLRVSRPIPHFRLINCETKIVQQIPSNGPMPPFVALSYVWGPQDQDHPENVVEDAIIATRLLGYQFLWVDRRCVDQNQQSDQSIKSKQILAMDAIYQSAEVTIIAAAGKNSNFGLPGVPGGSRPRLRNHRTRARVKGHVLTIVPPEPVRIIENSVWSTRAWTFQEGLLSRRRLIFTEREVFYECQGMISREAIELPLQVHRWAARWAPVYEGQRIWPRAHQGTYPQLELEYLWELIAKFGSRQLSKQSDALNAFLGVLQLFSEGRESCPPVFHLCGIPFLYQPFDGHPVVESFLWGLCWFFDREAGGRVRRQGFPSWSWTGWEGSASWIPTYFHTKFTSAPWVPYIEGDAIKFTIVDREDAGWELSWLDFELLAADKKASLPQNCQLRLTGTLAQVAMHDNSYTDSGPRWVASIHVGDDVIEGHFYPDRSMERDPGFFERLEKDSWLAVLISGDSSKGLAAFLLVEKINDCWERVGLIKAVCEIEVDFRKCTRKTIILQ